MNIDAQVIIRDCLALVMFNVLTTAPPYPLGKQTPIIPNAVRESLHKKTHHSTTTFNQLPVLECSSRAATSAKMSTPALNASIVSPKGPPSSSKQLTIFVTTHVSPSDIEKFKEAHRPVWKKCSEEPECLLFEVLQDSEVKGRFRFVEVWSKSREWFEKEQMSKPYYETLWEKSKPLWTQDIQIEYFEREGEGFSWSDEYLIGGKRMEKDEVVV